MHLNHSIEPLLGPNMHLCTQTTQSAPSKLKCALLHPKHSNQPHPNSNVHLSNTSMQFNTYKVEDCSCTLPTLKSPPRSSKSIIVHLQSSHHQEWLKRALVIFQAQLRSKTSSHATHATHISGPITYCITTLVFSRLGRALSL